MDERDGMDEWARAELAWASQGKPVGMLADLTREEIYRLAQLVDGEGRQVADFRQRWLEFWNEYFEARKASSEAIE